MVSASTCHLQTDAVAGQRKPHDPQALRAPRDPRKMTGTSCAELGKTPAALTGVASAEEWGEGGGLMASPFLGIHGLVVVAGRVGAAHARSLAASAGRRGNGAGSRALRSCGVVLAAAMLRGLRARGRGEGTSQWMDGAPKPASLTDISDTAQQASSGQRQSDANESHSHERQRRCCSRCTPGRCVASEMPSEEPRAGAPACGSKCCARIEVYIYRGARCHRPLTLRFEQLA